MSTFRTATFVPLIRAAELLDTTSDDVAALIEAGVLASVVRHGTVLVAVDSLARHAARSTP